MKDLVWCPNSLSKCKRGAKTLQNASKRKKNNTDNFLGKYIKQIINSNFANKTQKK